MNRRGKVRIGFTTGSAAVAAAKAGLLFLAAGKRNHRIGIPCPDGHVRLIIPVEHLEPEPDGSAGPAVRVTVRKRAGDDPDATHNAAIVVRVRMEAAAYPEVVIQGGKGVGTVTRPGLPVPVGEAAINPGPRRQMQRALLETLERLDLTARVHVLVEVPEGLVLAEKTLNPRLGILGGISILGTRGTVKAFSHAAWKDTIRQCLDVALAEQLDAVALSTGGRGQRFLEAVLPELPGAAFIQVGDHPGFALRQASQRGMSRLVWGGFWGKLVKMAQGRPQTHARLFPVDLNALAELALRVGVERDLAASIAEANTARHALDLLRASSCCEQAVRRVLEAACRHCRCWARGTMDLELILLDYDGCVIQRVQCPKGIGNSRKP
ncbi:cobalt-precorrin-5B (C1)-methyltransferase [Desulfonatronum thiosulfatophilum]|uniref:Cobalt-precorrin-5B C(1)-methyltransferase n=1 Tax=Desulfonatronum thiosulfatophilum TaxID=617002 RepID=A0A1G6AVS2_9BACT|nr:cobalt-precorrin-5B (C(1))-methyltransferase CbiD [Desulfonatronum thiosulfatophilum]SDB12480.1 cobalt-precorrin-5B (C1)-methyltransferase [Desulfonatronum thiosulfatophilum]